MPKLSTLLLAITFLTAKICASEEIVISDESFNKIRSDEFVNVKKSFAESPSLFQSKSDFNIPQAIAFDDSHKKISLTPGDVIKISEDLTFSDWGGNSSSKEVAEEDFTLPTDIVKKTEKEGAKTKNIQFSSN